MNLHAVPAADFDEFVRQLDLTVHGGLWEPALPSTVVFPNHTETHGPWPVTACAAMLSEWLKDDLLGIYRVKSIEAEPVDLARDEAQAVLADENCWRPALGFYLFPTAKGKAASVDE